MTRRSGRRSAEDRLELELRDHIERQVAEYVARGMSEADARRAVRVELGGLEQAKEACRDVRRFRWFDDMARDVALGVRMLGRDRFFAVSVTVILALGIGMSVTMFSVLHAVVLRPLPYASPGELAQISTHLIRQNQFEGTSLANFLDWRAQSRAFAAMTFYRRTSASLVTISGGDAPRRVREGLVGPEFFELLGTAPLLGRTTSRGEFDRRERVAVLSEGLWQEQFGRSADVVGRTISIDGESHVVIGVMPRSFHLPTSDTRLWRPVSLLSLWPRVLSVRESDQYEVLGRLAPGVRLADAAREMRLIAARLRDAHAVNRNLDIRVRSLFDHAVGSETARALWTGFAAVLALFVIACANVAGLLTTRAAGRRREFAVRSALGAGRGRLVRQLLAESVALWTFAGAAGLLLADQAIRLLLAYVPSTVPRLEEVRLDGDSVLIAFVLSLVIVAVCDTVPALVLARSNTRESLSTRDRASLPAHRLQRVLVTLQIGGALTLLVVAVLLGQSFVRARTEDPGYPAERLLLARVELPRPGYSDRAALASFFRKAQEHIGRLPGVVAVGGTTDFFVRRNPDQWVTVEGREAGNEEESRLAIEGVTPGYFRATAIELLEGRDFDERDFEPGAGRVLVVSDSLARRFWPGESAIGKRLVPGRLPPQNGEWHTIVGVVKDLRREGLDVAPILLAFTPTFLRSMDLTVHVSSGAEGLIPQVRQALRALDPLLPLPVVATAAERLSERIAVRRFEMQAMALFAIVALVLSAAGLYAFLAYQVTLRTREIGIRSALGADRRSIVAMIVGQSLRLAMIGAAVGLVGGAVAAHLVRSLLYDTAASDIRAYAAAATFILVVAAAATWRPARRAAGVSPMTALRED